jgi:hypothetical protein
MKAPKPFAKEADLCAAENSLPAEHLVDMTSAGLQHLREVHRFPFDVAVIEKIQRGAPSLVGGSRALGWREDCINGAAHGGEPLGRHDVCICFEHLMKLGGLCSSPDMLGKGEQAGEGMWIATVGLHLWAQFSKYLEGTKQGPHVDDRGSQYSTALPGVDKSICSASCDERRYGRHSGAQKGEKDLQSLASRRRCGNEDNRRGACSRAPDCPENIYRAIGHPPVRPRFDFIHLALPDQRTQALNAECVERCAA